MITPDQKRNPCFWMNSGPPPTAAPTPGRSKSATTVPLDIVQKTGGGSISTSPFSPVFCLFADSSLTPVVSDNADTERSFLPVRAFTAELFPVPDFPTMAKQG